MYLNKPVISSQSMLKSLNLFYKTIFFTTIFGIGIYLFYTIYNNFNNDIAAHLAFITPLLQGSLKLPEVGYEYTVFLISKIFHLSYFTVGIMVMAFALVILAYTIFFLLKKFLPLEDTLALLFTIFLLLVTAIYDPFFSHYIYVGQGSPNIWHNPTVLLVKPFAFLVVFLSIRALENKKNNYWLGVAFLLLTSVFYKPSFGMIFIPAFALYLILNHTKEFKTYIAAFFAMLPAVLYIFYEAYIMLKFGGDSDSGITIAPFAVLHLYSPNAFVSLLLALAFPLALLIFHFKSVLSNKFLQLSWITLIIAYLQWIFLAETGPRFPHANFSWGYSIALSLLFVFSFIEFLRWLGEADVLKWSSRLAIIFISILFSLHLFSGIIYFIKAASGQSVL